MASLKPKLFCGVAFSSRGEQTLTVEAHVFAASKRLTALSCKKHGASRFTPQYYVKRLRLLKHSRATPPHRQNLLDVAFGIGLSVQTGNYTDAAPVCQARTAWFQSASSNTPFPAVFNAFARPRP